ncbi:hypothetical protein [Lysobacter sp. CFH 32150]|uniref:hypothetical protein n=1 Tax=Lysobacter sp. CFH 32150 TaxID=2927128 RepID=UPI001FA77894|nr:hypothetical protein [Lysobacter sp. CFH 32150]MCI4567572.1 hypothetical protein [Lysobacter sp. CFH 32150]
MDISVGDQGDSVAKINAKLKQGDHSVDLSDSLNRVQGKPWINGTQLITVYASGTELINKISIPFLSIENGKVVAKKTVVITVSDGKIVNIEEIDTHSRSRGAGATKPIP